jgi:Tol biopolymer transport system component
MVLGSSVKDGNHEIYVMDADGTNVRNLTNNPAQDVLTPAWSDSPWSPDGSKIIFASDREGSTQLYVMDADGSNVTNISQYMARLQEWIWSPDGEWIYFTSDSGGNYNIWRVRPNGEDKTQLTDLVGDEYGLHFSPDGQVLSFTNTPGYLPFVYMMDPVSTNITPWLQTQDIYIARPQWAPDGQWLFAIGNMGSQRIVFLISPDGEDVRPLTLDVFPKGGNMEGLPGWQP